MSEAFFVSRSLAIDLLPSVDENGQPVLCLHTRGEPEQCIVVSLGEVYLLRDVLAQAGARLAEVEAATRKKRKTVLMPS
ncbi:MAG: hypothetical protein JXM69_11490 [Anaerolineae bacterium]|nr:hypothetical protein [Anaerolineae bacterium]